jgi:hypothetical protein
MNCQILTWHDPSAEWQRLRNEAAGEVELLDLQLGRLAHDLEAAREVERQEQRAGLARVHAVEVVGPAQATDQLVREHLGALEGSIAALSGLRNKARSLTGQLRSLGYAKFRDLVLGNR